MLLRLLLSSSIALGPFAAYAVPQARPSGIETSIAGPADLIIEAAIERQKRNPQHARELFLAAQAQIKALKLPVGHAESIHAIFDELLLSLPGADTPVEVDGNGENTEPTLPFLRTKFRFKQLQDKDLIAILESQPKIRDLLWLIGNGRLEALANSTTVPFRQDLSKDGGNDRFGFDSGFGTFNPVGSGVDSFDSGIFRSILESMGIMDLKLTATNIEKLRSQFEGTSIDDLADLYINKAATYSAIAGGAQGYTNDVGPKLLQGAAITGSTIFTFSQSAAAVTHIASLYGRQFQSEAEAELYLLSMFAIIKFALKYDKAAISERILLSLSRDIDTAAETFFKNYNRIHDLSQDTKKFPTTEAQSGLRMKFLKNFLAKTEGLAAKAEARIKEARKKAEKDMQARPKPVLDDIAAGPDSTGSHDNLHDNQNAHNDSEPSQQKGKKKGLVGGLSAIIKHAVISGGVAYGVTWLAKEHMRNLYIRDNKLQNSNFIKYLRGPDGLGFFGLLALAKDVGNNALGDMHAEPEQSNDPETQFILNLAGSTGLSKPSAKTTPEKQASVYNVLVRQLRTYNAVDFYSIEKLRNAKPRDRLKMAELILLFQLVDGEQSQEELKFFDTVVCKLLGVDSPNQKAYFNWVASWMRTNGVVADKRMATGFRVKSDESKVESKSQLLKVPIGIPLPEETADENGFFFGD